MRLDFMGHQHGRQLGPLDQMRAEWKLAMGLVMVVGTVLAPLSWTPWFLAVCGVLAMAIWLSRIPLLFLAKRLLLLSPLVLGVAAANAFRPTGGAPWFAVCIKSALSLLTVVIISNTTPFSQLLRVLRRARVPDILITTIALMHRYLFVLAEEADRMGRARVARTFAPGRRVAWGSMATVVSRLFVRSSERAERIYQAMCARGWK